MRGSSPGRGSALEDPKQTSQQGPPGFEDLLSVRYSGKRTSENRNMIAEAPFEGKSMIAVSITAGNDDSGTGNNNDGNNNDENDNRLADVGETISYIFAVTNEGNVTLNNVTVIDPLVTVVGGPTMLDVGETDNTTFMASYTIIQADIDAGKVDNIATADSDESDPADGATTTPLPQDLLISIVKTFADDDVTAGGDGSSFTLVVTNTGNVTLSDVLIEDDVDP